MKKRIFPLLAVAALAVCLFAGCNSKQSAPITDETAQKLALKDAGLSKYDVADLHTHKGIQDNTIIYSIHFTVDAGTYVYVIDAMTGEILSSELTDQAH